MQQADQSDFKSIAFVVVESRGMTNPAQYSLKEMSQEVGRYFTNNHKCSMQPHLIFQLSDIKCTMVSLCIVNVNQLLLVRKFRKNCKGIVVVNIYLCLQAFTCIEYLLNGINFVVEN